MKVLLSLVINNPRIMKFTEAPEVHGDLIIQSHKLGGLVEVLQVFMMIKNLNEPLD